MGRSCSVPGCLSNEVRGAPYVSTFSFPKDEALRAKWVADINRKDFTVENLTKNSGVCIHHFDPQFILRSEQFKDKDGNVIIEIPRKVPVLAKGAYPTIFKSQPKYISSDLPMEREDPSYQHKNVKTRHELKNKATLAEDKILSFDDFKEGLKTRDCNPFSIILKEDYVLFIKIEDSCFSHAPTAGISIKISRDLEVNVFQGSERISTKKFKSTLADDLKCTSWSCFDNLISTLKDGVD